MKNKVKNILKWICAAWCFLFALVCGFSFSGLLLALCGIALLPIKPVQNIWQKIVPNKFRWLKRGVLLVVFFVALAVSPTTETSEPSNEDSNIAVEQIENDEQDEKEAEDETEQVTETEKDSATESTTEPDKKPSNLSQTEIEFSSVEDYSSSPYSELNGNMPTFAEVSKKSFEEYAEFDNLGRCGVAYACIGRDIMPTEERGTIGQVKPTGWHTIKYDIVDGKYLYNRCHLIGYQLAGENANTKNLITGTRYLNVEGMLPFENMVADYVEETNNHVMYRVTPHFEGNNLLASGVQMEAYSVEDNGKGICFNVYVYNVQPGIIIDYATGDSRLAENASANTGTNSTTSSSVPSTAVGGAVVSGSTSSSVGSSANNSSSATSGSTSESTDNTADSGSSSTDSTIAGSGLVWKSATGKKYHSVNDCGNMNPDKAVQITLQEAIDKGLGKCENCH